jgi:hypothetical protein
MKSLPHEGALFTLAELAGAIGADVETVKNWVRRGIVSRARVGGRQMRTRLFTAPDVYQTAVMYELVKLGLAPSAATQAAKVIWTKCDTDHFREGKQIYAILFRINDKWTTILCSQREEGGPLYKLSPPARTQEKIQMPDRAFAMVPITGRLADISIKLEGIVTASKTLRTQE